MGLRIACKVGDLMPCMEAIINKLGKDYKVINLVRNDVNYIIRQKSEELNGSELCN